MTSGIFEVRNVRLGRVECKTVNPDRAVAVFEREIADPINRHCHIELLMDRVMIDHAGGLWDRGQLLPRTSRESEHG